MDVVVVGAGVMGCAVAWGLATAGARVTVLERAIPGAEASSAAAGILAPLAEAATAGPLLALGLASLDRYPALAAAIAEATGVDVGFRTCGVIHVALDDDGVSDHDRTTAALHPRPIERLDGDAARHRWPFLGPVRDALWLPTEGVVDNRRLVDGLHRAAEAAGARFVAGRTVTGLEVRGCRVAGVRTDDGLLEADHVAICAGAWTSLVGPPLAALRIRPVRGQMLLLRAPAPPIPSVVFAARRGYLVPRDDGRVLVGSTMEEVGYEKAVTAAGLRHLAGLACDVVPGLSSLPVADHWAGFRPATPDGLPALGRLGLDNLWVASGHHRNGILLTPISAEIVVAGILGRPAPVDAAPYDPARFAV